MGNFTLYEINNYIMKKHTQYLLKNIFTETTELKKQNNLIRKTINRFGGDIIAEIIISNSIYRAMNDQNLEICKVVQTN